jgi:hypothetical protein
MPAVSKKQFAKMFVLYRQKKITKAQLDNFTRGVDFHKLPVRKRVKRTVKKHGGGKKK